MQGWNTASGRHCSFFVIYNDWAIIETACFYFNRAVQGWDKLFKKKKKKKKTTSVDSMALSVHKTSEKTFQDKQFKVIIKQTRESRSNNNYVVTVT